MKNEISSSTANIWQAETPVPLGLGELKSFEDELQHDGCEGLSVSVVSKVEATLFQAFEIETESGCVPAQHLDLIALLIEKAEEVSG